METSPVKAGGKDIVSDPCELEPIDIAESSDLIRLEKIIGRGLGTFIEVGEALAEIRDRRLYRIEHQTFEAYCREKWNLSRIHAHRLITASETVAMLPTGNKTAIKSERAARELAKIEPERRADVVADVVASTGGNVTGAAIREAGGGGATKDEPTSLGDHEYDAYLASPFGRAEKKIEAIVAALPLPTTTNVTHAEWLLQSLFPPLEWMEEFRRAQKELKKAQRRAAKQEDCAQGVRP